MWLESIADGCKTSIRNNLLQVEESTGKTPKGLTDLKLCPIEFIHLLDIYGKFNKQVELSYQEILAWSQLSGVILDPLQVDLLMFIHRIVVTHDSKH